MMKSKILALVIGMLLLPFAAFGMQNMDETEMDSITGQSGVAISIENVQIYQTGGDELWYRGGSDTAAVGIVYGADTASYTFITAIKDLDTFDGGYERGNYTPLTDGDLTYDGATVLDEAPDVQRVLSIRVLAGADSNMFLGNDDAHIEIGLPTLEIVGAKGGGEELQLWIGATDTVDESPIGSADTANFSSMGTIYTSDSENTTAILGGTVGITAAGSVGDLLNESP